MNETKTCKKCNKEQPISEFGIICYTTLRRRPRCRTCMNEEKKSKYVSVKKPKLIPPPDMKICAYCKQTKNIEDFSVDNSRPDHLHVNCRSCLRDIRRSKLIL